MIFSLSDENSLSRLLIQLNLNCKFAKYTNNKNLPIYRGAIALIIPILMQINCICNWNKSAWPLLLANADQLGQVSEMCDDFINEIY